LFYTENLYLESSSILSSEISDVIHFFEKFIQLIFIVLFYKNNIFQKKIIQIYNKTRLVTTSLSCWIRVFDFFQIEKIFKDMVILIFKLLINSQNITKKSEHKRCKNFCNIFENVKESWAKMRLKLDGWYLRWSWLRDGMDGEVELKPQLRNCLVHSNNYCFPIKIVFTRDWSITMELALLSLTFEKT
jgi:hypothetical protein